MMSPSRCNQIIQSALHPLEPCGDDPLPWWMRGEKPWQLLSACFEVQRAMASGNPETYLSNLPVHQVPVQQGAPVKQLQKNAQFPSRNIISM